MLLNSSLLSAQENNQTSKNEQRNVYTVYYKQMPIGEMIQEYQWKNKDVIVNSVADFSFLYFSFGGNQQSDIYWNAPKKLFLSHSFNRKSIGFSVVDMQADFYDNGHKTVITNNGKKTQYENIKAPIVDFNSITLQISQGVKSGKTEFEFYMQTSDDIAHYFFKVTGKETISTKLGDFEAYRVEQVKKEDRIFIAWFSPDFNYQMIKFHYKRKVLDIHGELMKYSNDTF